MGRPRKNRVGEYAQLLSEEFAFQLSKEINIQLAASKREYLQEIGELRNEIKTLNKQIQNLEQRLKDNKVKPKLGKWVPGGPGRPPKDAQARVEAFSSRSERDNSSS
tara:strand:- start:51 stop:371 length:321 start_codon:yes stop_codon:yes gene_type:complete